MRAHTRSGVTLTLLALVTLAIPWSAAVAQTSLTGQAQAIIGKVPASLGAGAGLSVIRDGVRPAPGTWDSGRQYDSWDGNNTASEDWVGYTFASPQTFSRVVFQEGHHFSNGGWFLNLTVQVRVNNTWVAVQNLTSSPAYPGNNGVTYETFTLNFSPIQGDAIRLHGAPGGSAAFISVGELDVFGTAGTSTPPATASVTAEAQTIIGKVPASLGAGAGLSVIRDGVRPAPGTWDSGRQYDSWDGNNTASEDWVGYTFASPKTFTRVVFQEGHHFSNGGWFLNLTVQVRVNNTWVAVQNLTSSPAYPGNNGVTYETFTLNFSPIQGDAIRLHGAPGGSAAFISVGELDVFASSGGTGPVAGPDLTVQSLTVSPGSVSPGGSVNLTFTVRNAGTATAAASSVGVYLASSPDATLPGSGTLKTMSVQSLAAGASTVVTTSATLPNSSPGGYFIIVAADPSGTLAESAETNNRASAALTVAGATGGITVWVTDTLTRVQPTDPPGTTRSASIKAARNEYEAFQVIVRAPSSAGLSNVNAVASDLVGPAVISQTNVTLYRAHYIRVTQSSPSSPYPPGYYADALIPFKHPDTGQPLGGRFPAAPFPVSAGQNQPVWVEVFVPTGTPPGNYSGTVTLTASGVAPTTVPVSLTVWNFTLPAASSIRTGFGELWYFWGPFGVAAGTTAANDIEWRFAKTALKHRITVMRPSRTNGWFYPDGTALPADSQMREWLDTLGGTSWKIPEFFPDPLGADRPKMIKYLRTLYDYLAARGWASRAFMHPTINDEPNSPAAYEAIRNYAAMVHEANPNLQVLVTQHHTTDPNAINSSVDIWVTHFQGYNASIAQARRAAGQQQWVYQTDCWGGNLMGWMLDYPILNYRTPHWINWINRVDGLLYWAMTSWNTVTDPWTDTKTFSYGGMILNGEGSLFYPGNAVGYAGPIVSARLKALRDGMEDYEYLKILGNVAGASVADTLARNVGTSYGSWNRSPANLQSVRESVAQRIANP